VNKRKAPVRTAIPIGASAKNADTFRARCHSLMSYKYKTLIENASRKETNLTRGNVTRNSALPLFIFALVTRHVTAYE